MIFDILGHGGYKTVAKLGRPIGADEETETFDAEQGFGDVLISVTGKILTFDKLSPKDLTSDLLI